MMVIKARYDIRLVNRTYRLVVRCFQRLLSESNGYPNGCPNPEDDHLDYRTALEVASFEGARPCQMRRWSVSVNSGWSNVEGLLRLNWHRKTEHMKFLIRGFRKSTTFVLNSRRSDANSQVRRLQEFTARLFTPVAPLFDLFPLSWFLPIYTHLRAILYNILPSIGISIYQETLPCLQHNWPQSIFQPMTLNNLDLWRRDAFS